MHDTYECNRCRRLSANSRCPSCYPHLPGEEIIRTFETGASRDVDDDKIDFEAAMSPLAFDAMCRYMHHCRKMPDKTLRPPDNWQKGMPLDSYIKSAFRHFVDWWKCHRGLPGREGIVFGLCGLMFNVQGYLHTYLLAHPEALAEAIKNNPRKGWENAPAQSTENYRDANGREV